MRSRIRIVALAATATLVVTLGAATGAPAGAAPADDTPVLLTPKGEVAAEVS
jgi:hypothetical protein